MARRQLPFCSLASYPFHVELHFIFSESCLKDYSRCFNEVNKKFIHKSYVSVSVDIISLTYGIKTYIRMMRQTTWYDCEEGLDMQRGAIGRIIFLDMPKSLFRNSEESILKR